MIFKRTFPFIFCFLLVSCIKKGEKKAFNVEYHGALKEIMHKGDITAKVNLLDLKKKEHVYAIGALENLKGEIQIFDGKLYNSKVLNNELFISNSFNDNATLLVQAEVEQWVSIPIPENIHKYSELESFIQETVDSDKFSFNGPFPFLVEGVFNSVDWHVINWKEGDLEHSHEKHISSGVNGIKRDVDAIMLGFYSTEHKGVFSHHSSNMHLHFKTSDASIAGHVDDFNLGDKMILKLPKD